MGMPNNEKATLTWMRLARYFSAFNFELSNFHLFQQKVIPAWEDNKTWLLSNVDCNVFFANNK